MKKLIMLVTASILAVSLVTAADAKKTTAEVKVPAGTVQNYDSKEAKAGDTVICPVMKEAVKITDKTKSVTVKGKKYYICCGQCEGELKKNPDKYLTPEKAAVRTDKTAEKKTK